MNSWFDIRMIWQIRGIGLASLNSDEVPERLQTVTKEHLKTNYEKDHIIRNTDCNILMSGKKDVIDNGEDLDDTFIQENRKIILS